MARGANGIKNLVFLALDARHQVQLTRGHLAVEQLQQVNVGRPGAVFDNYMSILNGRNMGNEILINDFSAVDLARPGGLGHRRGKSSESGPPGRPCRASRTMAGCGYVQKALWPVSWRPMTSRWPV